MDSFVILLAVFAVILGYRFFNRNRAKRHLMSNSENVELASLTDLESLFTSSEQSQKLLFLHDPWCPISGAAAREVSELDGVVHLIDVSKRHDLSRAVESRTGVRHESPQFFVISGGRQIWNASHYDIQADDIRELLSVGGGEEVAEAKVVKQRAELTPENGDGA